MKAIQMLFLFVLIVPFVEIYLLMQVGGLIGTFPTILLVVFTAALGAWLLRRQGFATWQRFQASLAQGTIPAYEMIEGPILLMGGALLLTPGFFTDAMGFACLIPALRRNMARYIIENHLIASAQGSGFRQSPTQNSHVIDGEYSKKDSDVDTI
ncbi:FxsA family protein [Methylomonas rapida]|uniref:FxsA family protein n=1 Tax=Methylomonas rapida TaxID=2963939 RepID=A0ABY7GFK6_9GAMM|nr:FxsA family protein [Methylomonas rapida]WAR44055.1 FxsA family protein [Methylomonas rapida]